MARKAKPNHLTLETRRIHASEDTRRKRGDGARALLRCAQWARWRLEQSGVVIPAGATFSIANHERGEFRERVFTKGRTEEIRGPRGGLHGRRYIEGYWSVVTHATVLLPAWALPQADAMAWHEAHQARHDASTMQEAA